MTASPLSSRSAANAALPHYNPLTGNNANLQSDADTLLLIDSGGQYEGGTTDITRTILIGRATDAMKSDFTAVLRGHIALATTVFPKGVFGSQLDTLVRAPPVGDRSRFRARYRSRRGFFPFCT